MQFFKFIEEKTNVPVEKEIRITLIHSSHKVTNDLIRKYWEKFEKKILKTVNNKLTNYIKIMF